MNIWLIVALSASIWLSGCDEIEAELESRGYLEYEPLCEYDSAEKLKGADGIMEPGWGRHGKSVRLRQNGMYPTDWKTVANLRIAESSKVLPKSSGSIEEGGIFVCVKVTGMLVKCENDFPELYVYELEHLATSNDLCRDCFGQPSKYARHSGAERVADLAGANQ
ncbi:hypothetical protein KCG44_10880 [Pacificimonas sp. WHA3]|uniref:Lipoprotein n=1 Tax=Pacificimonas pallii TaxID=2827236 RepID=A0ABS6SFV3_9SPHN|nr:hypothetical protein [Pacificimonas pallii]MBV7257287.1 hypothetical protein [Pacificimonas pallii]